MATIASKTREKGASADLISAEALSAGHALSQANQPYLKGLFDLLCKEPRPITLVLGAGVSVDAGLPDWARLLDLMVAQIRDPKMQAFAAGDQSISPERRAEYVQQLLKQETNRSRHEMTRDALYPENSDPKPGQLVNALARLVVSSPERFTIFTTNFDELVETALKSFEFDDEVDVVSLGLSDAEEMESLACTTDTMRVVHLHGMLRRNRDDHLKPVILTEAEFLREGRRVMRLVKRQLESSSVIFIGLSLTDPNLVGPLWNMAHPAEGGQVHESGGEHYVLTVVRDSGEGTFYEVCAYELAKARYLREDLSLQPVFLKSYSQLIQLVSDMALACADPGKYLRKRLGAGSTRYGARLQKALNRAYSQVGCGRRNEVPLGDAAENLSNLLYKKLHGRNGPVRSLKDLHGKLKISQSGEVPDLSEENFGLSLWLRVRSHGGVDAPYAIQMIGTSVGAHREAWSFREQQPITRRSEYVAAKSLYAGGTKLGNVKPTDESSIWKGILATPITIYGVVSDLTIDGRTDTQLDRVTIGVAVLTTTSYVLEPEVDLGAMQARQSLVYWANQIGELTSVADAVRISVGSIVDPTLSAG